MVVWDKIFDAKYSATETYRLSADVNFRGE